MYSTGAVLFMDVGSIESMVEDIANKSSFWLFAYPQTPKCSLKAVKLTMANGLQRILTCGFFF
jgi:hypothetical protein